MITTSILEAVAIAGVEHVSETLAILLDRQFHVILAIGGPKVEYH